MSPADARPRILFVDDEPAILRGIRNALRRDAERWDLVFAAGAQDAIDLLAVGAFDVVVTDARMAGLDGSAVLAATSERHPRARRIVLTGYAEDHVLFELRGMAHEILIKPCSTEDLREALRRALG